MAFLKCFKKPMRLTKMLDHTDDRNDVSPSLYYGLKKI